MAKKKRRLEPVRIVKHDGIEEVRFQANDQYWHTVTPADLTFNCKCPRRAHTVTWLEDIPLLLRILAGHRDELWNLICDGEAMLLIAPGEQHQGKPLNTRLVGVIWPSDGTLTFVS